MAAAGAGAGSDSGNRSNLSLPLAEILPRGYYFLPSNAEALLYLKRKILGQQLPADVIPTADVYGTAPDQLPLGVENNRYFKGNEKYFFTRRPSLELVTENGYWTREEDTEIKVDGTVEGFKQELVYYYGVLGNGERTPWHIWEYRMNPYSFGSADELDDDVKEKIANLVMCKVFLERPPRPSRRRRFH